MMPTEHMNCTMKYCRQFLLALTALLLVACSTTSGIPDDDQLYVGLLPTKYSAHEKSEHYATVTEELEAALSTPPNGALLGSSRLKWPFPIGLWIWNTFAQDSSRVGQWIMRSFGTRPILMSWVNPALRASVAREVLRTHGYMRGQVDYKVVTQDNPKKAKIAYDVQMGHLFTVDTLTYVGFAPEADSLIHASMSEQLIHPGSAFDISTLDGERQRLARLFRNNGYYYYQPSYASYLADTISVPGKVQLHFQLANDLPAQAQRKWYIGRMDLQFRRQVGETLRDSVRRRTMTIRFNGRRPPLRTRVVRSAMKLKRGELYSYQNHAESMQQLTSTGLFSMVDFRFTPRNNEPDCDTLDLAISCVMDKPYDFYITTNLTGKTNNYVGPGMEIGITKRNAFRGGETLNLSGHGNYEWQTNPGGGQRLNSYEYGFDASLEFPRLVMPWARQLRRRHWWSTPTTVLKAQSNVINRAKYFKRHIVSGEWNYTLQPNATLRHQISPLVLSYEYTVKSTATFDSIITANPYLYYTMQDQFIPKMQYTLTYTSPVSKRNPLWLRFTASEAGNLTSLGYLIAGKPWGKQGKQMLHNPYAQFFKVEGEAIKTWQISQHSTLVAHVNVGALWAYGNSAEAPYGEQFFVGGANSIRAFTVRSIGPGSYHNPASADRYYLDQTGDLKLLLNLEYRPRLVGNLYGALFLDAGNVWTLRDDERAGAHFRIKNLPKETALGTGLGLRYDMDFLVLRVDWGIGLHVPYRSGFYNVDSFSKSQSLHFAVGYPF